MLGLRLIRIIKEIKQVELAEYLNVSQPMIADWELGRKPIPKDRAYQLASYFGVKPSTLSKEIKKVKLC